MQQRREAREIGGGEGSRQDASLMNCSFFIMRVVPQYCSRIFARKRRDEGPTALGFFLSVFFFVGACSALEILGPKDDVVGLKDRWKSLNFLALARVIASKLSSTSTKIQQSLFRWAEFCFRGMNGSCIKMKMCPTDVKKPH